MVHPVQVRPISNDEGNRLLRIVRRGTGSVVTWRRAQMVLLSAQHMPVAKIAEVTFTSSDRVRDVLHNFTTDGFDSLYPRYAGGRPPKFDLKQRPGSGRSRCPARPITTCRSRCGACRSWPISW
jgi:Winged helix-turn helix